MENKFSYEDVQKFLKGKLFLVGFTFITEDETVVEQFQTHGYVEELTDDGIIVLRQKDDSFFRIPYDPKTIDRTIKAEYREKATGEVIENPDYVTQWEIVVNEGDDLSGVKKHGFATGKSAGK